MVAVVGFYCNAGEHRSVAMAEVFKRYLDSSQFTAETCHSCDRACGTTSSARGATNAVVRSAHRLAERHFGRCKLR